MAAEVQSRARRFCAAKRTLDVHEKTELVKSFFFLRFDSGDVHAGREGSVKGARLLRGASGPLTGSSRSAQSQRKAKELPPDM